MLKVTKTRSTHAELSGEFTVLLFYKYVDVADPKQLMDAIRAKATELNLKGRVIIATEGLNGTLEGANDDAVAFAVWIKENPLFADMHIKTSQGYGDVFPKLSVKVRPEIVTLQALHLKPHAGHGGKHIPAEELHKWFEEGKDFIVLDMRNGYEYDLGHFEGARKIPMRAFKEMRGLLPQFQDLKKKTVVAVCTGGVRCEKGTAVLREEGFENVYQLDGGIHTYMEKFPKGYWKGPLYTFDRRTTMDFTNGESSAIGNCYICNAVGECMGDCSDTECTGQYVICAGCHRKGKRILCDHENHLSLWQKIKRALSLRKTQPAIG